MSGTYFADQWVAHGTKKKERALKENKLQKGILMNKAIYAFSGDPITFGHIDIIKRASDCFDEVIVGIGSNPDKKYMFSLEERTEMARRSLKKIPNVKVQAINGLLVDYAYEQNISTIVKGVRDITDFGYENILHQVGESQKLGIDTFILFAKPELAHVSSGVVKAIQKEHGLIHDYVTLYVKQSLELTISRQFIIGVTGEIGVGKSYVSDLIVSTANKMGIPCHNIDLDRIGHQILEELKEPRYQQIRNDLINKFGKTIGLPNGMINRKALGQIVFTNSKKLQDLNQIMLKPILVRLKREFVDKKGIIILNGALLAEAGMLHLCNNNIILLSCQKNIQQERLKNRGLNKSQLLRRVKSQYSFEQKKKIIDGQIAAEMNGKLWTVDSSRQIESGKIAAILKYASTLLGKPC
jgi:pantetheine-phosphate adenylyltransferase/dephospho-CoA kinase